jgi:hypothetical protein
MEREEDDNENMQIFSAREAILETLSTAPVRFIHQEKEKLVKNEELIPNYPNTGEDSQATIIDSSSEGEEEEADDSDDNDGESGHEKQGTSNTQSTKKSCKICGDIVRTIGKSLCGHCRGQQQRGKLHLELIRGRPKKPLEEMSTGSRTKKMKLVEKALDNSKKEILESLLATGTDRAVFEKDNQECSEALQIIADLLEWTKRSKFSTVLLPYFLSNLNEENFKQLVKLLEGKYTPQYLQSVHKMDIDKAKKLMMNVASHPDKYLPKKHIERYTDEHLKKAQQFMLDKCPPIPGKSNSTILVVDENMEKQRTAVHFNMETWDSLYKDIRQYFQDEGDSEIHSKSFYLSHKYWYCSTYWNTNVSLGQK